MSFIELLTIENYYGGIFIKIIVFELLIFAVLTIEYYLINISEQECNLNCWMYRIAGWNGLKCNICSFQINKDNIQFLIWKVFDEKYWTFIINGG